MNTSDAEAENQRGTAFVQAGDFEAAEQAYLKSISRDPALYKPHANLGNLYTKLGRHQDASESLERAVALAPDAARLWIRLGQSLDRVGATQNADEALARGIHLHLAGTTAELLAADLAPELAFRLTSVALDAGLPEPALQFIRRARAGDPANVALVPTEIACLSGCNRLEEAFALVEATFAKSPSIELALMGADLAARGGEGSTDRAHALLTAARAHFDRSPDVLTACGRLAREAGDTQGAFSAYEAALAIDENHPGATFGLGIVESTVAPSERSVELLERAVRLQPASPAPFSALLFAELHAGVWSPERRLSEHRRYAARFGMVNKLARRAPAAPLAGRRLRIGYLSADFRDHALARFIEGILRHHDRSVVDVFLYAAVNREDGVTDRIRSLDLTYRDVRTMTNQVIAQAIADDRVDVLVTLDGFTRGSRVQVVQHRPAPVQVSYLGYPATLGLDCVDFRITDGVADPAGADAHYAERLLRLPHTAWCYSWPFDAACARTGDSSTIVFGCFNRAAKLSAGLLSAFSRILQRVPGSRLLLKNPVSACDLATRRVRDALADIDPSRVEFLPFLADSNEHLKSYGSIDVALDTFPYAGTTTTCDALWMGVPVVTLAGNTHVERVGASLLGAVGLDDCVASDIDGYVARAVTIAADHDRRAELRRDLRDRMRASPLGDPGVFARSLERAFTDLAQEPRPDETAVHGTHVRPVRTDADTTLMLPDSLSVISTFVFLEQRRWFEDEVPFVRALTRPGDVIVDIGANLGAYSLDAAARAGPSGRVVAFEPSSTTAAMLRASGRRNGATNLTVHEVALGEADGVATLQLGKSPELNEIGAGSGPGESVTVRSLSSYAAELRGVSFVKLDAEGSEAAILRGSGPVFVNDDPLVMFELRHGSVLNVELLGDFERLGFQLFQLCPGLGALVPLDASDVDPYLLNVFAARKARMDLLERRGLCLGYIPSKAAEPASDDAVGRWIAARPVLVSSAGNGPTAVRASLALRYLVAAMEIDKPLSVRYAALRAALASATTSSPGDILTAARITRDLGRRSRCVELVAMLQAVAPELGPPEAPFACPIERYATKPFRSWELTAVAQALEVSVKLGAYSTFYQPPSVVGALCRFIALGGDDDEMDRRLGLLLARHGAM